MFNFRHSVQRSAFVVALLTLIATLSFMQPSNSAASKGYLLKQELRDLGPISVAATMSGISVDFEKYKCKLVAHAPDWQVYLFRPTEKLMWVGDINQTDQILRGQLNYLSKNVLKSDPAKASQIKLHSIENLVKAKNADVIETGEFQGFPYRTLTSEKVRYRANVTFKCLKDFKVAPQCAAIIGQLCALGPVDQMPIFAKKTRRSEAPTYAQEHERQKDISFGLNEIATPKYDLRIGPQLLINTTKIQSAQVPAESFAVPEHYKEVVAATQVLYSSAFKNDASYKLIFGE
ncbi:MAG TPA: hypothetical protein V6C97_07515 [Oculatellaceae cyanobacterium]